LLALNRPVRASRGETAVHWAWNRYDRLNILGAVALSPRRRRISTSFAIHDQNVRAAQAAAFVKQLPSPLPSAAGDVLGRWQVPRTAATRSASRRLENIHLEWLPAYAPELNPVEPRWSHTKFGKLANFVPDDTRPLKRSVRSELKSQSPSHPLKKSLFKTAHLSLSWGQ